MKNRIFITGAAGLVGSEILQKIATGENEIMALYRKTKSIEKSNIDWIKGDISDANIDLRKHLVNVSTLIHNAAMIGVGNTAKERELIQIINIDFTQKLFNWALESKVKKIIFTSSFSFIKKPLPDLITEESPTAIDDNNLYATSKLICEEYLKRIASEFSIPYTILRLSSPVSFSLDSMSNNVIKTWIYKSLKNETLKIYGKGNRTQDFVGVDDIANAFNACLHKPTLSGTFNIASGTTLSMLDLAKLITERFKNNFVHEQEDANDNQQWNISIDKARQVLGYSPIYTSKDCVTTLLDNVKK